MTPVWLHGTGMNAASWGEVPGVALNLPGHAGAPRTAPTVQAYADALMPHLPEGKVALIGHSLGGMIAIELARRLGPRCGALVLIDAPLWLPCGPFLRFAPALAEVTSRVPGPKGIAWILARRTAPGPGRAIARTAMRQMSSAALRDAMKAAISYDARPALRALTCPILAFWAQTTTITNAAMKDWFETAQPTAASRRMPTGHMAHLDNREAVVPEVLHFFDGL